MAISLHGLVLITVRCAQSLQNVSVTAAMWYECRVSGERVHLLDPRGFGPSNVMSL